MAKIASKIKKFITLSLLRGQINHKILSRKQQLANIILRLESRRLSKQEKLFFSNQGLRLKKQINILSARLEKLSSQQKNVG